VNDIARIRYTSRTMVFLEEFHPRGWNMGSFLLFNAGDLWIDYPVSWHNRGGNASFADVHVEYFQWSDRRTVRLQALDVMPNNPDMRMLQKLVGDQVKRRSGRETAKRFRRPAAEEILLHLRIRISAPRARIVFVAKPLTGWVET
jgi:prepilin-type processing-associated H-X9-DG protein